MKTKIIQILTLALFILPLSFLFAQQIVSGTVTSSEGVPLPGATVQNGSFTATATDFDGNYAISASQGDVLTFSYVGYESQEVRIRGNFSINIQLEPNTALDEVVVL